jgi:hypothetical protein
MESRKEVKAWLTTPSLTVHRPTFMGGDMAPRQQNACDIAGFPRDGLRAVASDGESTCIRACCALERA